MKIAAATAQGTLLDAPLSELEPVPVNMAMVFEDAAGSHTMMCGDWETSATFWKWRREYGEEGAIGRLTEVYEQRYTQKGLVLALGTVAKRPKQWLLLGVIRLDPVRQPRLL